MYVYCVCVGMYVFINVYANILSCFVCTIKCEYRAANNMQVQKYPLLDNQPALMRAYQQTIRSGGDGADTRVMPQQTMFCFVLFLLTIVLVGWQRGGRLVC